MLIRSAGGIPVSESLAREFLAVTDRFNLMFKA
jgi:hypothetical protein